MSNSRDILKALIEEDAIQAKKLINEALLSKLGNALEEKLADFAPTVFSEGKKAKPDFLDLDDDGDKKEPMKKAAKEAKGKKKEVKEDVEISDELLIETFQAEVAQIVQEIQEETGEELTEEEIQEIAEEYLQILEGTEEVED